MQRRFMKQRFRPPTGQIANATRRVLSAMRSDRRRNKSLVGRIGRIGRIGSRTQTQREMLNPLPKQNLPWPCMKGPSTYVGPATRGCARFFFLVESESSGCMIRKFRFQVPAQMPLGRYMPIQAAPVQRQEKKGKSIPDRGRKEDREEEEAGGDVLLGKPCR